MEAPKLSERSHSALRPSERIAYESPAGFLARDFLGHCRWNEVRCQTFQEAFTLCIGFLKAGGRPQINWYGYDPTTGEECRCLVEGMPFNKNGFLKDWDAGKRDWF